MRIKKLHILMLCIASVFFFRPLSVYAVENTETITSEESSNVEDNDFVVEGSDVVAVDESESDEGGVKYSDTFINAYTNFQIIESTEKIEIYTDAMDVNTLLESSEFELTSPSGQTYAVDNKTYDNNLAISVTQLSNTSFIGDTYNGFAVYIQNAEKGNWKLSWTAPQIKTLLLIVKAEVEGNITSGFQTNSESVLFAYKTVDLNIDSFLNAPETGTFDFKASKKEENKLTTEQKITLLTIVVVIIVGCSNLLLKKRKKKKIEEKRQADREIKLKIAKTKTERENKEVWLLVDELNKEYTGREISIDDNFNTDPEIVTYADNYSLANDLKVKNETDQFRKFGME